MHWSVGSVLSQRSLLLRFVQNCDFCRFYARGRQRLLWYVWLLCSLRFNCVSCEQAIRVLSRTFKRSIDRNQQCLRRHPSHQTHLVHRMPRWFLRIRRNWRIPRIRRNWRVPRMRTWRPNRHRPKAAVHCARRALVKIVTVSFFGSFFKLYLVTEGNRAVDIDIENRRQALEQEVLLFPITFFSLCRYFSFLIFERVV